MKKILITGANGLLGQNLQKVLEANYNLILTDIQPQSLRPIPLKTADYFTCDITQEKVVYELITKQSPDMIIHTAAMTDVDGCETNPELAIKIHVNGTENIVKACSAKTRFVILSTDYVFNGKKGPYREADIPSPISVYGKTKYEAEQIVQNTLDNFLILRTTVMYGHGIKLRLNFPEWVISKLSSGESIRVVDDQWSNTTLAGNAAALVKVLLEKASSGIYNIAGSEIVSRFHFAEEIADCFSLKKELIFPCKTEELKQKALRPLQSGFILDKIRAFPEIQLLSVTDQLKQYKKERYHV
jgi:dTDP-4-dehydrorhamnose reductase